MKITGSKIAKALLWTRHYALDIATAVAIAALIVLLTATSWLTLTSPAAVEIDRQQREYFRQLEQEHNTPAGQRAWRRLYRKHGQPGAALQGGA